MKNEGIGRFSFGGLVVLWLILIGFGYSWLLAYHSKAGAEGSPPPDWPGSSLVSLDRDRPTLLIFIHPRCPCSAASLTELGEVQARTAGKVTSYRVDSAPQSNRSGREAPLKARQTSNILAHQVFDRDGKEAERFRVETSGHVLLYDTDGRLRFSGGITAGRGHEGPNPGLDLLVETILGQTSNPARCPVYGCSVLAPRKRAALERSR